MVCIHSDSKEDDVDIAEELVSLDLNSDWKGEDQDVQNIKDNNFESDQEEIDKYPLAKKGENSSISLSQQKCLKLCVRKMLIKYKFFKITCNFTA